MKSTKDVLRELEVLTGPFYEFNTTDLPENPSDLFLDWVNYAIQKEVKEPHAMTLSTVDDTGMPDARVLILKDVTDNKWFFASSAASKKGEQLRANAKVALTFYWPELARQIRIRGTASKMSKKANEEDFLERSKGAKAITLIGKQSKVLTHREELEEAIIKAEEMVKQSPYIVSPDWTLYAVNAKEVEFWQGDPERKHKRVQYQLIDDQWEHRFLWP